MDLTPIYAFIGLMCAVFSFGLITIDHKPTKGILLVMMLASLGVGANLHNSIQQKRLDAANQQIITLANCHGDNLDPAHVAGFCSWSTK